MIEYLVDARLIHRQTLLRLNEKKYDTLICVSEHVISDYSQLAMLKGMVGPDVDCVFCRPEALNCTPNREILVVFESLACLCRCLKYTIEQITVIFLSAWGQKAKYYGNGLYLTEKDFNYLETLKEKQITLYYQPFFFRKRIRLDEMLKDE